MGGAGPHANPRKKKTEKKPSGQKSLEKHTSLVSYHDSSDTHKPVD